MRSMFLLLGLLLLGSAQAALVTFDDFPSTPDDTFPNALVSTPQGFEFAQYDGDAGHIFTSGGTLNTVGEALSPGVVVMHTSGGLFSLQSLDIFISEYNDLAAVAYGGYRIQAFDINNQLIAQMEIVGGSTSEWQAIVFDATWSGIKQLSIDPSYTTTGFGVSSGAMELDNFSATVVPIPAALWLFGSALAGLGWLRRSKTA
jgi:hypothetical protein